MADAALPPLQAYGLWAMAGTFAILFAFLGLRGFERACHWLLALSFSGLAATGFVQLYAAPLRPLLGAEMRIDVNRARQQHSLWAERELTRMQAEPPAATTPAG